MVFLEFRGDEYVIPKGWVETNIGNVVERVQKKVSVIEDRVYQEIGIRSHGKGIFYKEPITGTQLGEKNVFWIVPDCLILNIVFAWEQAVAVTSKLQEGMIASHRFPMYKSRPGKSDQRYFYYLFMTKYGKHLLNLASPGGAGRNKTLGQENFLEMIIELPPFEEQVKIAEILTAWDDALETLEKLIAAKLELKRGLMQELLTGKKRFQEFATQKLEIYTISDVANINPRKSNFEFAGEFVAMENVSEDGVLDSVKQLDLSSDSKPTGFTQFQNEDTLVAKITPCFENGKGAFVHGLRGLGLGSTEFHVLRPYNKINPRYLYFLTRSHDFRIRGEMSMQGSGGQLRVPTDFIAKFEIYLPPLEEQKRVAEVLTTLDTELESLRSQLSHVKTQKKGLMQQLLTGKVRVKV